MSDQDSSDCEAENNLQSRRSPAGGSSQAGSSRLLKAVVRQQQDATKTCRLLALEVGSLKAELTRQQKKSAQAISRASKSEAALQQAEQKLHELQYANSKLQQELNAAKDTAETSSRRISSLRQRLADAEAEATDKATQSQQQVTRHNVAAVFTLHSSSEHMWPD